MTTFNGIMQKKKIKLYKTDGALIDVMSKVYRWVNKMMFSVF